MTTVLERFRRTKPAEREDAFWSFQDWVNISSSFLFNGVNYTLPGASQEDIGSSYTGLARGAYKGNGVVFACMANRMLLFSEVTFKYRRQRGGRPGDLFTIGDPTNPLSSELGLLANPWEGGTTGDLLARMIQHVDIAGNSYVVRQPGRLTPLRPDWTTIIGGVPGDVDASVWHPEARVLGYMYQEGGSALGKEPAFFLAEEVAHFAPIPDPEARFRGMSWLTPIVREIMGDKAMNDHKLAFLENGATPNIAVKLNVDDLEKFKAFVKEFKSQHEGASNAYKTMFLAAGADVTPVGTNLQQLDFKTTQGAGETRIAAAAGVPPVIVGLSEGLQGSSLNAGNYQSARRRFADHTMRPLWRNAAGSLARIIRVPSDADLWYDTRDVAALQEDQKDAADIQSTQAATIKALVDAGYESDSVVKAVTAADFTLLNHTGLFSVQLQPPGTVSPPAISGGNGTGTPVPAVQGANGGRTDLEMLQLLLGLVEQRREQPIYLDIRTPDVTVQPAETRFEPGAIEVNVHNPPLELPAAPDVHVTVEAPLTRIEEGAVAVHLDSPPAPDVNVTFETPEPKKPVARHVEFSDGRTATVTDKDGTKTVEYGDGRKATVTDE